MHVQEIDSIAEALSISVVKCQGTAVLAGFGCRLKAFQCPSGAILLDVAVLRGSRIHGIIAVEDERHGVLLAIHGARQLVIAVLTGTSSRACGTGSQPHSRSPLNLQVVYRSHRHSDWILDAKFTAVVWPCTTPGRSHASGQRLVSCDIALGMMNNYVELWRVQSDDDPPGPGSSPASASLLATAASTERLLLYSMQLAVEPQLSDPASVAPSYSIVVASGTIFHTILVWTADMVPKTSKECMVSQCHVLFKLCGHCGSVVRLQWACEQSMLLSTADDRTARVWRLPESWWRHDGAVREKKTQPARNAACAPGRSMLLHTLWGHTARVWDATLIGSLVGTAAEDGAVRFWDVHSGNCVATMRCHAGHGVWCCAAAGPLLLITGGGDCALKLWSLSELLPVHYIQQLSDTLSVAELQRCGSEQRPAHTAPTAPHTHEATSTCALQLFVPLPSPPNAALTHGQDMPLAAAGGGAATDTAARAAPHGSTAEGVCALALAAPDVVYVATSLGRILRMCILPTQQHDHQAGPDSRAAWSSVCEAPQAHVPLSCCAARRCRSLLACRAPHAAGQPPRSPHSASHDAQGFSHDGCDLKQDDEEPTAVDVVVCGARRPGLSWACVAAGASQPAVMHAAHAQLAQHTQAPILAVWMPQGLPAGHVLCTDSDNSIWWVFLRVATSVTNEPEEAMFVLATCSCGPKARVASLDVVPACGLLVVGSSLGGVAAYHACPALTTVSKMAEARSLLLQEAQTSGPAHVGGTSRAQGAPLHLPCLSTFHKMHASSPVTLTKAVGNESIFTGGRNGALLRWAAAGTPPGTHEHLPSAARIACCREVRLPTMTGIVDVLSSEDPAGHSKLLVAGFKANQFMLWDVEAEVELLGTASGGWRRPFAVWLGSGGCFTAVLLKERQLKVAAQHVAVVTASEDGSVRVVWFRCNQQGAVVRDTCGGLLLGKHAAGGAIRCLHAACMAPRTAAGGARWLLLSAGAKEVQVAWEVSYDDEPTRCQPAPPACGAPGTAEPAGPDKQHPRSGHSSVVGTSAAAPSASSLQGRWLATLPPPKVGLRPKRNVGFHTAAGERRTMALCMLPAPPLPPGPAAAAPCYVVQAASAGALTLQKFCPTSLQWLQVAHMRHGDFVVLSIAATPCMLATCEGPLARTLVCAGSTAGTISVFDVSDVIQTDATRTLVATHKAPACRDPENDSLGCISPLLTLPRVHQTGVNAACFTQVGDLLWLVTGGDDQALTVNLLELRDSGGDEAAVVAPLETVTVDCAHVSAVKGLCSRACRREDGRSVLQVCSIGWDEFLRVWQLDRVDSPAAALSRGEGPCDAKTLRCCSGTTVVVREILNHGVDVCEPCCVAGCDSGEAQGVWNVVVGGRGTQLLALHV